MPSTTTYPLSVNIFTFQYSSSQNHKQPQFNQKNLSTLVNWLPQKWNETASAVLEFWTKCVHKFGAIFPCLCVLSSLSIFFVRSWIFLNLYHLLFLFVQMAPYFAPDNWFNTCYAFGDKLGEGGFGIVRRATHLLTTETVAIKIMNKAKLGVSRWSFTMFNYSTCLERPAAHLSRDQNNERSDASKYLPLIPSCWNETRHLFGSGG